MPRHFLLVLLFLIQLKCIKSDILLNKFKSELGDWNKNMPKLWFSYIRKHLYKQLNKYIINYRKYVNNIMCYLLSRTKLLLVINKKPIIMNKCQIWDIRCIAEHPVGQFVSYPYTYSSFDTLLHWNLNPRLRLNLLFFIIDFSLCLPHCSFIYFDHLMIGYGISDSCFLIAKKEQTQRFCGQYSTFSFYSKDNSVKICYDIEYFTHKESGFEYRIVGMFMTIDQNEIFNEAILHKYHKLQPELVYNIKQKYVLERFYIRVNTLDTIILRMNNSETNRYVVIDGPGVLCNTLSQTKKHIITSTFQCLILHLYP